MAQALADILAQLDPVYNPQKQLIQQQQAALPAQQQAEMAGLDQAKTNAFGDINVQANDRGMSYSGMPIAEQAKYTGSTYLPAVANLKNTYANKGFQLQGSLASLDADRMKQAQGVYNDQLKNEQDYALQQQKLAQEAANAKQNGLDMSALLGATSGGAAASPAPKSVADHFSEDVASLLNGYKQKYNSGYTERTVIPKLQKLYPEYSPQQVASMVYSFRKQNYGE